MVKFDLRIILFKLTSRMQNETQILIISHKNRKWKRIEKHTHVHFLCSWTKNRPYANGYVTLKTGHTKSNGKKNGNF